MCKIPYMDLIQSCVSVIHLFVTFQRVQFFSCTQKDHIVVLCNKELLLFFSKDKCNKFIHKLKRPYMKAFDDKHGC